MGTGRTGFRLVYILIRPSGDRPSVRVHARLLSDTCKRLRGSVLHCADLSRGCYVSASPASAPSTIEATTIRKVRNRIIPFMFVLMVIAFLDRTNIGFAALTMNRELGYHQPTVRISISLDQFGQ